MANLYVTEQSAIIRKTSDRLIVQKKGTVLLEVPCHDLDTVLIYGNVQVTTQALAEMLEHGIELALFSLRGKLRGQVTPIKSKNIVLRMRQYELASSETFGLRFSRLIVQAKIESAAAVLRRYWRNHPDALSLEDIKDLERSRDGVGRAQTLDALRGVEGSAAAKYFSLFGRMTPSDLPFNGRNRRPPRDPVNALLSFGYVLVGNELQSLLDGMGFDPYLGFFHQVHYGRPSLALDLLEEFRAALVDRFTLRLLNLGTLRQDDFTSSPDEGVLLRRDAMKRFFAAWEKELITPFSVDSQELTFRELFRRQAERLARTLTHDEPYEPFRLPC